MAFGWCLYNIYHYYDSNPQETNIYMIGVAVLAVILSIIYIFSPQIDWWWFNRNPPKMHEKLRMLLQKYNRFYRNLTVKEKERFRKRVSLYMHAHEFKPMGGPETLPEDVRGFIAAAAVQLTFGQKDFTLEPFEHIILYPGAFPSPQYPKHLHNSEHYKEDGVIMFSIKSVMDSTTLSPRAYHVLLHEYASVFETINPKMDFPALDESIWETLESISGMSKEFVHESINIPKVSPRPVSIHHFFVFPEKFQEKLPTLYNRYKEIFNLDPCEMHEPVLEWRNLQIA